MKDAQPSTVPGGIPVGGRLLLCGADPPDQQERPLVGTELSRSLSVAGSQPDEME